MHRSFLVVVAAGTVSLAACATNPQTAQDVGTGAAIGAGAGAVAGAVLPGVSVAQGAIVGAAIGGLAGATWASRANNGVVDGYYYNGQYYPGVPAGYDPTLGRVVTGAAIGGAVGAGVGAVTGAGVIPGAVVGAAVGGLAGAVWADRNNDGVVDGYIYNGQYYPGTPPGYMSTTAAPPPPAPMAPPPPVRGERG